MWRRISNYLCPLFPLRGKYAVLILWIVLIVSWVNACLFWWR